MVELERSYRAVYRYARVSPQKARRIMDTVRGRQVDEALAVLKRLPHRSARMIEKVISSALANAQDRQDLDPSELCVATATVDEGPRMKRLRPICRGMATIIQKRMSHLTVVLQPR